MHELVGHRAASPKAVTARGVTRDHQYKERPLPQLDRLGNSRALVLGPISNNRQFWPTTGWSRRSAGDVALGPLPDAGFLQLDE
jgi:hypothetical protein